jgi:uncharacterized Ntn-hydrolase superfamily protein
MAGSCGLTPKSTLPGRLLAANAATAPAGADQQRIQSAAAAVTTTATTMNRASI